MDDNTTEILTSLTTAVNVLNKMMAAQVNVNNSQNNVNVSVQNAIEVFAAEITKLQDRMTILEIALA